MLSGTPSVPAIAEAAFGLRIAGADALPLSSLLRVDPVFVLRMLRASDAIARPPGEGAARRIDAIIDAGGHALIQAALLDTHQWSKRREPVPEGYRRYWAHSLLVAETARELSLRCGRSDPDDAFFAGLLLDVALPLLAPSPGYAALLAQGKDEFHLSALETASFGVSHPEIGASLLPSGWSADFVDALRFHHADTALFADAPELMRIVRAAEELAGGGAGDAMQHATHAHALTGLPIDQLNDAWQGACLRASAQLASLGLADPGSPLLAGELYFPQFESSPVADPDPPALLELARAGLLAQALAPASDKDLWQTYRLAASLLLDLPAPSILLALRGGGPLTVMDAAGEPGPDQIDLSNPRVENIRLQLERGEPWYCDDAQQAASLPVSIQRLLRSTCDQSCLLLPMVKDGALEAVALHRLSAASMQHVRGRTAELASLANATAGALRTQRAHARDLGDLRRSMVDHYAAHSKQLRADLHTPLGLLKHQVKSMRLKMGADSMLESELSVFSDQMARIDAVLQQFENRPPDITSAAQWTDVNQLLEQVVAESDERSFRARGITTELHLDSALPPLHLPLAVMRDIVAALLSVSAEQIGSSGRIAISSADGVNWNGGLHAEIRIRDFGRGMDAARVAALFAAPSIEGGSRQALAHVLAQTRALGGSLSCKSALGQGTVFQLLLPRQTRRRTQGAAAG